MGSSRFTSLVSLTGPVLLWVVAATLTDDAQILPMPWNLIAPLRQELASGELLLHLGATLGWVIWAIVLAMLLGLAMGRVKPLA